MSDKKYNLVLSEEQKRTLSNALTKAAIHYEKDAEFFTEHASDFPMTATDNARYSAEMAEKCKALDAIILMSLFD